LCMIKMARRGRHTRARGWLGSRCICTVCAGRASGEARIGRWLSRGGRSGGKPSEAPSESQAVKAKGSGLIFHKPSVAWGREANRKVLPPVFRGDRLQPP